MYANNFRTTTLNLIILFMCSLLLDKENIRKYVIMKENIAVQCRRVNIPTIFLLEKLHSKHGQNIELGNSYETVVFYNSMKIVGSERVAAA